MEHRHIFLTGEKQVGKSTIWQTLLEGRPHTGFITEPFFVQDVKRGYILHSILELPDMMNDVPCVIRVNERRQTAVPPVFEGAGVKALEKALADATPIILMDELGKVERQCDGFLDIVRRCLDDDSHHVLGVVQRGDTPMQREVMTRNDILRYEVTPDNRGEVRAEVEAILRKWGL